MRFFLLLLSSLLPFFSLHAKSFLFIEKQECVELPSNAMLLVSRDYRHAESYGLSVVQLEEPGQCLFATNLTVAARDKQLLTVMLVGNAAGEILMSSPRKFTLDNYSNNLLSLEGIEDLVVKEKEVNSALSEEVSSLSRRAGSLKKDALLIGSYAKLEKMQQLIARREDHVRSLDSILTSYHAALTKEIETQPTALQQHQMNQLQKILTSLQAKHRGDKSVVVKEKTGYLDEVGYLKKQIADLKAKREALERKLGY